MKKRPTAKPSIHIAIFLTMICLIIGFFPSPANCRKTYKIAILPEYLPIVIYERFNPLLDGLGSELNVDFELIIPKDFDEHMQMIQKGEVDFSYQNPYVVLELWPHLQPLAITEKGKKWGIEGRGVIVAKANGGITKPDDIMGKRVSIVSFHSANGYIAQKNLLKGMMIHEKKDYNVFETSNNMHHNVVIDVLKGTAKAGFLGEETLSKTEENAVLSSDELANIQIIARTSYIPNWIFCARKKLNRRFTQKVKDALINIPINSLLLAPAGIRRFVEIPSNYLEEYRSKNP
jgi:ABC-type phosphate/phosphonate transport system substrate-binding protein